MTRKRLWTIITSILVVGGLVMVFSLNGEKTLNKEEYKAKLLRQEQENIAIYLVNEYENIKSIEFDDFQENDKTGYLYFYVYINQDILIRISFDEYGSDDYRLTFHKDGDKLVERNNGQGNLEKINIELWRNTDDNRENL